MKPRNIQTFATAWSGIAIRVKFERNWLSMSDYAIAHIEVEAVTPERAVLPISETGYRSHFCSPTVIDGAGGPIAFVLAWLEAAALSPDWARSGRQLSLFD